MWLEKISNKLKTQLQNTSESLKKAAQISLVTAWIVSGSGCSEVKNALKREFHATVEEIPYTKQSPFSLVKIRTNKENFQCNIFRFQIDKKIYSGSAKHCFQDKEWENYADDIIILPNLQKNQKIGTHNGDQKITQIIELWNNYHAPHVRKLSPLSHQEIQNEVVTLEWIFPDQSWDTSYKISGKPFYNEDEWVFVLILNNEDFKRIMKNNTNQHRSWFQWMSWSPVLDSKWQILGVHIAGYSWNNATMEKNLHDIFLHDYLDSGNVVIFNPIRDKNGEIKTHMLKNTKIQTKNTKKEKQYLASPADKDFLKRYNLDAQYYTKTPTWRIYFGIDTATWEKKSIHIHFKQKEAKKPE